jgi:phosphoribosylformylglycinamidine cyclo-ligase
MERVFNMGIGMTAIVNPADADRALRLLAARRIPAWHAGEVTQDPGGARLSGTYQP